MIRRNEVMRDWSRVSSLQSNNYNKVILKGWYFENSNPAMGKNKCIFGFTF